MTKTKCKYGILNAKINLPTSWDVAGHEFKTRTMKKTQAKSWVGSFAIFVFVACNIQDTLQLIKEWRGDAALYSLVLLRKINVFVWKRWKKRLSLGI